MYPNKIATLVENKQFSKAIDLLLNYLNKKPYDISAWCDIGYCFLNFGNYYEAIRYSKVALMLSNKKKETNIRPVIYLNLAQAYKCSLNYKEAMDCIDEYFKLINDNDEDYQQAIELKEQLKNKFQCTNI